jgi:SNF2 family DNA or RNA helicase
MGRAQMDIRVGRAGNGTPVFLVHGQNPTFGRVFGATWDPSRALWMYPAFYPASEKVLADLQTVRADVDVVISDVAQRHVEALADVRQHLQALVLPTGFEFITAPYHHQVEGLCHVFYNMRAALFYDPGLGKSKIAIDLIRLLRHNGNRAMALVLGPRITVRNWGREIDRHSGRQLTWATLTGTPKQKREAIERAAAEGTDIVLATYDTARSLVDLLVERLPYGVLVCDESHSVKAWRSERTKTTYEIAQKAVRRVLMTGSPTEGNPLDLYGPYKILGDCFMPENYFKYKKTFVITRGPNSPIVVGYKNLDVVNARTTFLSIRRTKEQCLDLPKRTFINTEYALSAAQTRAYDDIVTTMGIDPAALMEMGIKIRSGDPTINAILPALMSPSEMPHRAAALTKLLQITSGFLLKSEKDPFYCDTIRGGKPCEHREDCAEREIFPRTPRCHVDQTPWPTSTITFDEHPKLDAIMELLEGILADSKHKVIIWCAFHIEMDLIEERLVKEELGYVRVDGDVRDPMSLVDSFNDDPNVRVYIGQVTTGLGITLNSATYMIYSSLPYSLNAYSQCLDRNYRIGQNEPVTVYRMLGYGTLEAAVAHLLDHKVDVDFLLTNKIECALCPRTVSCLAEGIEPFQRGCIHPKNVNRPVVKAYALPMLPGGPK